MYIYNVSLIEVARLDRHTGNLATPKVVQVMQRAGKMNLFEPDPRTLKNKMRSFALLVTLDRRTICR